MSQGIFKNSVYQSDFGSQHRIRVQPETEALILGGTPNAAVDDDANNPFSARVSGSRRGYGLFARTVTIKFPGNGPDGYKINGLITLPWLDSGTFAALVPGASGTYLGFDVELIGKRAEVVR